MCLRPIKIRNPAKAFALEGGQPLELEVPCGRCAECKKNKRAEWNFRSFYHASECINNGGYVYYDTLTYSPEHLPMFSDFYDIEGTDILDFSCFNNDHWRNFLKNLRSYLAYHYPDVKFTYFLTSEYGTDDLCTHRPHYHVLFFVNSLCLSPYTFSRLVSQLWIYGRTDGLPYKTLNYVDDNIFYRRSDGGSCDYLKVCSYVSKYITKDSTFQKTIDARKEVVAKYVSDPEDLKKLFRHIDMFHRQSQGFGLNYITTMNKDEYDFIMKYGCCRKKDSDLVVSTITLPLYYKRKLFYKCVKRLDDSICWQLNDEGKRYTFNRVVDVVEKVAERYYNLYRYMSYKDKECIDYLLGPRNLFDFAVYKLYYKGRMRYYFNNRPRLHPVESDLYSWIDNIISSSLKNDYTEFAIIFRDIERDSCTIPMGFGDLFHNPFDSYTVNFTNLMKHAKFNQHSVPEFSHFDELDELFKLVELPDNVQRQKTFDFIEDLTKKFKVLYEKN